MVRLQYTKIKKKYLITKKTIMINQDRQTEKRSPSKIP